MRIGPATGATFMLAAGAFCALPAAAAVDLSGTATVGVMHDSNALQLSNVETPPPSTGGSNRDDTTLNLGASVAVKIGDGGPLQAQLQTTYTHLESKLQDSLSRDDYQLSANVDWKPSRIFDVSANASQNRLPLGLADVGGIQNIQQQTSQVQGTLRLRPTPSWQLSLAPAWNETKTPLPGAEDFRLRQKSGMASLAFLGAGKLVPGISYTESRSRNADIANATRYQDEIIQGTLNYQATGLSTFSFAAGHSRRTTHLITPSNDPVAQAREGTDGAFTGSVSYNRQLSVKTRMHISAFRYFQQYEAGVNNSVGTGFDVGANWAPTRKIAVDLSAAYNWSTIDDLPIAGSIEQRKDLLRRYSLTLSYQATRLMSLRALLTRQMRTSDVQVAQYGGTIAGLELSAKFD